MNERVETAPVLILTLARSFSSVTSHMIGQHPEAYGFPEVNLFVAERVGERAGVLREGSGNDGLLRLVAELVYGRQTPRAVADAGRWLWRRRQMRCVDLYRELIEMVAPRVVVDKSPMTGLRSEYLLRTRRAFPEARYIHLVRHPRTNCASLARRGLAVALDAFDYSTPTPTVDYQRAWFRLHANLLNFLSGIPASQKMRVRGEDLLEDPDGQLRQIAEWLGWSTAGSAIESMKHPEDSPFACFGPRWAPFGNDASFMRDPVLRPSNGRVPTLKGPLPWRSDGQGFTDEVKELASEFGYS